MADRPVVIGPGVRMSRDQEIEIERLRVELRDLAEHGLRFDLNPTMDCRDVGTLYAAFAAYLQRIDSDIRARAAAVVSPEAPVRVDYCTCAGPCPGYPQHEEHCGWITAEEAGTA